MDAPAVLARLRGTAETIMLDACTITRPTQGPLDEATGQYPATQSAVYSGPCRLKPAPTSTVDSAGISVDATRPLLELPWVDAAAGILPGDAVTMTAGPLGGVVLEVYAEVTGTTSVARRYTCEQRGGGDVTVRTPRQFAEHLATTGRRLDPVVTKTINRAAMNIKEDWRQRARVKNPPTAASATYPSTIVQRRGKVDDGVYTASVESLSKGQGLLGSILEYGGAHNAPQRSNIEAAQAEAPNLAKWLAKAAAEAI